MEKPSVVTYINGVSTLSRPISEFRSNTHRAEKPPEPPAEEFSGFQIITLSLLCGLPLYAGMKSLQRRGRSDR